MDYQDSQVTLGLLDSLANFNMTRSQFVRLHHLGESSDNLSISGHRAYCKKTQRFDGTQGNAATATRLAICLHALETGATWDDAIEQALTTLPIHAVEFAPTAVAVELEDAISKLISQPAPSYPPAGQPRPTRVPSSALRFKRDPEVAAYVERRAKGRCEHCETPAPFLRVDGRPFLEIHHIVRLADGGSDRVSNTTALCPNCHRLFHHATEEATQNARLRLYKRISELKPEVPAITTDSVEA